jgi:hypothetical protein
LALGASSLTDLNGYTIGALPTKRSGRFASWVSIDFPTAAEQDAFRGRQLAACHGGHERHSVQASQSPCSGDEDQLPTLTEIAKVAFAAGANYRVNVYPARNRMPSRLVRRVLGRV